MDKIPIKCVIVGDPGVGKSSLLWSYTSGTFPGEYIPTLYEDYRPNIMVDGHICSLSLFDTSAKDEYEKLRPLQYNEANVFIVCFSAVSRESFTNVRQKWCPEIRLHCQNVPMVIVATKSDLKTGNNDEAEINQSEGFLLIKDVGAKFFLECSAKTSNADVKRVFDMAARAYLLQQKIVFIPKKVTPARCVIV